MSFESRVVAFSERFVSSRSHQLIVAPALADLQFEETEQGRGNRLAVIRALAGAVRIDAAQHAATFLILTLVPACYYFVLIAVCFDFFSGRVRQSGSGDYDRQRGGPVACPVACARDGLLLAGTPHSQPG